MSADLSKEEKIVCKPTKWFLWRALAMLTMFSIFAVLFFMDGMWGYREKNLHFYVNQAFIEAGVDFQKLQNKKLENDEKLTESQWRDYAAEKKVVFPDGAVEILPRGTNVDMPWPGVLLEGFEVMDKKGGQSGSASLWEDYTASRKDVEGKAWDIDPGEEPMNKDKIREQFIALGVTLILVSITLFFFIRTMCRKMEADHEALYTQEGKKILYSDMVRVDKRKWDTKGIALIYYTQGGEEKKAKVDGMVYGQFKEEDGAPAEKLFSKIMENFKGEVLEYVSIDDEDDLPEDSVTKS